MPSQQHLRLNQIAEEVSLRAVGRPIGEMQGRRTQRLNLEMVPSLFDGRTIWDRYAFHVGGLSELQFNIGVEEIDGKDAFRHGIAFSLQPARNAPDYRAFIPRIERFNEFLRTYPNAFADLQMWHSTNEESRSENYPPVPIPGHLIRRGSFIFLGTLQPVTNIDIGWILDDFDRLVQLYEYVEGTEQFPQIAPRRADVVWSPGNNARAVRTSYRRVELEVDNELRHNVLQPALFAYLVKLHGEANVSGEQNSGEGTLVDVAVRTGDSFTYYEIKTALSAQNCIRQALGQLMEYSYWPGVQEAEKLVIVGEKELDISGTKYLALLRARFKLPLYYQRFDLQSGQLDGIITEATWGQANESNGRST